MTLYFENEYEQLALNDCFPFDPVSAAEDVIKETLHQTGCPFDAEACLTLVSDEGIRELNRQFRGIDSSTDVLSFPVTAYTCPGHYEEALAQKADSFHPDSGALILGDIVISVDHPLSQAREYGHSVKREFCFLVAHSALHLIGYDHMDKEEEETMCRMQEQILAALGIQREQE